MAKPIISIPIFSLFVLLICLLFSGGALQMANGQRTWCTANPISSDFALAANIDFVCGQYNCSMIEPGGSCFEQDNVMLQASFVMNLYFQANGRRLSSCSFGNSGLVSLTNPSYGNCTFQSGGSLADQEPSGNWCIAKPGTTIDMLQRNIDFACNQVNCSPIQSGGACFFPNTLINHASYAMNLYYQITGGKQSSCDFRRTALIVSDDPGYGNCSFLSY